MDYLSDLLSRADLQHVMEYILNDGASARVEPGTAEERLEAAETELLRLARAAGGDALAERIYHCCAMCEGVYAELGMRAGAVLTAQLLAPLGAKAGRS